MILVFLASLVAFGWAERRWGPFFIGKPKPTVPPRGQLTRRPRVYLAGPITNGNGPIDWANVWDAIKVGLDLMTFGFAPFIPQLSCFAESPPELYDDWLELDFAWIEAADVLYRLPGPSRGADREVAYAEEHGVPVVYSERELMAWTIEHVF